MKKTILLGLAALAFAATSCSGDGKNSYVGEPIGKASENEYHDCLLVTKYNESGLASDKVGASRIYCVEDK